MPLKSTRSFSGKLLKRYRSKTKLNEEEHREPVPALPTVSHLTRVENKPNDQILPGLDVTTSWNIPLSLTDGQTSLPLPRPRAHRRSRSFSELLSTASNGTTTSDFAPAQPWRDRDAWAAIHSPSQGPVKSRKEASVMDRTYGWMERDPEKNGMSSSRDVKGRDQFKFFHNTQDTSSASSTERDMPRYHTHGRSRLGESTNSSSSNTIIAPIIITTETDTRPASANDSSSTVSSMELSTNPHTPPTSLDQHFNPNSNLSDSATSTYSDDLPLPPLLPHNVKRADSPPAFTSRFPTQVPWAQRSTIKDIRETSNLRWATGMGSGCGPSTPPPPSSPSTTIQQPTTVPVKADPPRTPPSQHRRKRSMTAPSVFDNAQKPSIRPESGTLPLETPSPPRPPRHPKRQTRAPPPIPLEMPVAAPHSHNPSPTPTSREDEFTTPLSSPMAQSPTKAPSAFYKPTLPLRSVGSATSLRPGSRRPSTAPTQGSTPLGRPVQIGAFPSPPPSSTSRTFDRLSRNTSSSSATRGGWI